MRRAALAWMVALAALASACSREGPAPPLPTPDRVSVGELRKREPAGDITDPAVVAQVHALANELRAGRWQSAEAEYSSCGTVVLRLREQDRPLGYLALDGETFFTNGPEGGLQQAATPAARERFLALVPRWFEPAKCVARVGPAPGQAA
jgi:hypothetical protein